MEKEGLEEHLQIGSLDDEMPLVSFHREAKSNAVFHRR